MAFWWVNHKQTFRQEFHGGYIWSPQKNSNNSINQSYTNLTRVKIGDLIFSYSNSQIKAIGIVEREFDQVPMPPEFGSFNESWSKNIGYRVRVDWILLHQPIRPKDYLGKIAPLLPEKLSPIQRNGNGNQGTYLASINEKLGDLLMMILEGMNPAITSIVEDTKTSIIDELAEMQINQSQKPELERIQIIKARTGQGTYRQNLLMVESRCRVTGIDDSRFLIASHIKPWRDSNDKEKLDGHNGLLLSPHVDSLFDKAFISFSKRGDLLVADSNTRKIAEQWKLSMVNIGKLLPKQAEYMEYHRDVMFAENSK